MQPSSETQARFTRTVSAILRSYDAACKAGKGGEAGLYVEDLHALMCADPAPPFYGSLAGKQRRDEMRACAAALPPDLAKRASAALARLG